MVTYVGVYHDSPVETTLCRVARVSQWVASLRQDGARHLAS